MDELSVLCEPTGDAARAGLAERIQRALREATGLTMHVQVLAPGGVPRSEGKAVRVIDKRPERPSAAVDVLERALDGRRAARRANSTASELRLRRAQRAGVESVVEQAVMAQVVGKPWDRVAPPRRRYLACRASRRPGWCAGPSRVTRASISAGPLPARAPSTASRMTRYTCSGSDPSTLMPTTA